MRNKLVVMLAVAGCCIYLGSGPVVKAQAQSQSSQSAGSQQPGVDQDIKLLREDIRSKKKQLIAANLKLTDEQATKFWPIYDQYTADLVKINNEKYALIKEYADTWGTMTDDQALSLANRALAVEKNVADLRIRYVPIFSKAVPGKTVATFYQIERRVQSMIDLQLGSQLPLVQSQE
jgi:Spy/CpxP family protein refolding chaperone